MDKKKQIIIRLLKKPTKNKIWRKKLEKPLHYYTQIKIHVFQICYVLSWGLKVSSTQGWQDFYNTHMFCCWPGWIGEV
jgi:hypothetical protein